VALLLALLVALVAAPIDGPPVPDRVSFPAACVALGCRPGDAACEAAESPRHHVCLGPFALDRAEVTVEAYQRCVAAGACPARGRGPSCNAPGPERALHPANCVPWTAARDYCAWAGGRLPTEAEWERAAGGAEGRLYPWGSQAPDARLAVAHAHDVPPGTAPVCSRPAGRTPEGLCDLAGNVFEWVADAYDAAAYRALAPDVRDPRGPCGGAFPCQVAARRVLRGGGFALSGHLLRASARSSEAPDRADLAWVGFRCAGPGAP
jgi:formylglycine-generating enzyme required for sulfatase activity